LNRFKESGENGLRDRSCRPHAIPVRTPQKLIRRLGLDPALASSPMPTKVTDMCGFFLILSFATAVLVQIQT
jgi:hypothetical protein